MLWVQGFAGRKFCKEKIHTFGDLGAGGGGDGFPNYPASQSFLWGQKWPRQAENFLPTQLR